MAFPVLDGAKDTFAEKAVALRLECTVVDRFWFFDFTMRPTNDVLRTGDTNPYFVEERNIRHCFLFFTSWLA